MEKQAHRLYSVPQAHGVMTGLWERMQEHLKDGHRLTLEVRPETRSDAQNRLLHSRLGDVARQCEWAGQKWDAEDWKRLITAAWCRANKQQALIVPSLDGQGFDVLYRRTSQLSRAECVELSDYIMAWGSEREVNWSPASLGHDQ